MSQKTTALLNVLVTAWADLYDGGTLEIKTTAEPATGDSADTGVVLASVTLPADAFGSPAGGVIGLLGTWLDSSNDNTGTAEHFVIKDSGGTSKARGTITATGGGGDMTLDDTSIQAGGSFTVTSFSLTST